MSGVPQGLELIQDRYELVRQIAKGGMGVIYEGLDRQTGARCAVKLLKGRGGPHSPMVKRFKREAQLGEQLGNHPGIVFIYDSGGLDSGDLFCVMEFADELEAWLGGDRPVKPVPPEFVAEEAPDDDESSGLLFLLIMAFGAMILGGVIVYVLLNR